MSSRLLRRARGLLALFLLTVMFSVGRGDEDALPPGTEPEHDPFALYSADDGALQWGEMSASEQAIANAMMDWSELHNGAAVHNAFSTATGTTTELRLVEEAQRSSNLEGIETLGVVP